MLADTEAAVDSWVVADTVVVIGVVAEADILAVDHHVD